MELTKSEMEIMDVFWGEGKPLSRSELLDHGEEKTWKDSSIHILLNSLLAKGIIREAGFVRCSKTYGRTFEPTMSREEYYIGSIFSHRHKPAILGLMGALLERPEVTQETLDSVRQMLDQQSQ